MSVKFCPACGTARQEGDAFCRNCGRSLAGDDARESSIEHGVAAGADDPGAVAADAPLATAEPSPPPAAAAPTPPPAAPAPSSPPAMAPAAPPAMAPTAPPPAPPGYVVVPASQAWTGQAAPPMPPAAAPTTALPTVSGPGAAALGLRRAVKPLALVGAGAVVISVFLPWVSGGLGSGNGFEVPLAFLWSLQPGDGLKLGFVLLVVGAAGAALSFVPGTGPLRRIVGIVAMVAALAFLVQLYRLLDAAGGDPGDVVRALGFGSVLTLVGGGLLAASK